MVLLKGLVEEAKKKNKGDGADMSLIEEAKKRNPQYVHGRSKEKKYVWEQSGFKNVMVKKFEKQYSWKYSYNDYVVESDDFIWLRERVIKDGYEWGMDNFYYASKTCKIVGLPLYDLK